MTNQEAVVIFKILKTTYPNFYKNYSVDDIKQTVETWAMMFEEETFEMVVQAVKGCLKTCKFPPSIAEIFEKLDIIKGKNNNDDSGIEAWNEVMRAIADSNYNSTKYFDKFDEIVKRLVGSPNQLREWAMMELTTLEVAKSHFLKSYKQMRQKDIDFEKLPASAKKLSEMMNFGKVESAKVEGRIGEEK